MHFFSHALSQQIAQINITTKVSYSRLLSSKTTRQQQSSSMGNQTQKPAHTETEFINHPKFQNVHILEQKGEHYVQIRVPVHSQKEVKQWEKSLEDIKEINKEALLLPHSHSFQKEGLCGSTGIVTILYENYPYLLSEEIKNRREIKRYFEEGEVWYLLFTIVSAAKDFEARKTKLGDVRPGNIFINDGGQIKIANVYSWPSEPDNYNKTLLNHETTLIAPEQVKELQTTKSQPSCNPSRAESFSIGLTILDAAMLLDSQQLYNVKSSKFDYDKARACFQDWEKSIYSQYLKKTILSMLELEPNNRKLPSQIFNQLLPYEDDINNLRDFASALNIANSKIIPEYTNSSPNQKLGQLFNAGTVVNFTTQGLPGSSHPIPVTAVQPTHSTFTATHPPSNSQIYAYNPTMAVQSTTNTTHISPAPVNFGIATAAFPPLGPNYSLPLTTMSNTSGVIGSYTFPSPTFQIPAQYQIQQKVIPSQPLTYLPHSLTTPTYFNSAGFAHTQFTPTPTPYNITSINGTGSLPLHETQTLSTNTRLPPLGFNPAPESEISHHAAATATTNITNYKKTQGVSLNDDSANTAEQKLGEPSSPMKADKVGEGQQQEQAQRKQLSDARETYSYIPGKQQEAGQFSYVIDRQF